MKILLFTITIFFLFTGCVPKVNKLDKIEDLKIQNELLKDLNQFHSKDIQLESNWWEKFNDPQLNNLIKNAITNSPTIKQLEQKFKIATNLMKSTKSRNLPSVDFDSNISRKRYSENYIFPAPLGGSYQNLYNTGLNINYDFDFWDERASLIKATENEALAQKALIKVKQLAISTSITKLYISWNFKIEKIRKLNSIKKLVYEKHLILGKLNKLGLENKKRQNESNYKIEKINQNILRMKKEIENIKESIAVIAGLFPSQIQRLNKPKISNKYQFYLPKDIHLDVISHLPKIAVQKYLLASKDAYIKNAKAKFYPNISIKSLIGFTSFPWSNLFKSTSFGPEAGVAVSLPLFDGNRRKINLNSKLNDYNSQVYAYNQSIIEAINKIVKTLKLMQLNKSDISSQKTVLLNKIKNKNIEKKIFKLGLKNKLSYIDSKIDIQKEDINSIILNDKKIQLQIELIKSLGGGYKNKVNTNVASN
ncbi:TolC family protein [Arcobacter sp. CECT 8985]|uniref:TolC family protein n=1 Tax=Arcobacter sp. CECT 8985 TaxID=1935424 RepID=UPI00100BF50F|nr:TolC family protein [Arcobacter sp. CECT 8985]RXJ86639.1 hypothetical protein CRU93_07445 [Arcobacter sp. CECT 8985]